MSPDPLIDEPEELEPLPPDLVAGLQQPASYADGDSDGFSIEYLQTHISHLFLTPTRVYKFRKAVALPFVSFATRERRDADCVREIALNRRLAPDVYLGLAPLRRTSSGLKLGEFAETLRYDALEHCVVMRRLPTGRDSLSLLEAGRLEVAHVDRLAALIARFHADAALDHPVPRDEWYERARQPFLDVIELARDSGESGLSVSSLDELALAVDGRARALADCIETRRLEGRGVDGHGDLHLQHVWFERDLPEEVQPIVMDCVEFRSDLRQIDAASEVACFAMDLRYRGRADLAERFLSRYAWERDDFGLFALVDFFAAYRAAVRGGVAAVAAGETELSQEQRSAAAASARAHLELAGALLQPRKTAAGLVLMTGTVGSGKSTVARAIADEIDGVVIGSDRTRKSLAGLEPTARGATPMYTREQTKNVYLGLLERAAPVVESGRVAILDATFARRADRERAAAWARQRSLPTLLAEAQCSPETAHRRLERRARMPSESDAGPEFLAESLARYEPCTEWPSASRLEVDTNEQGWRAEMRAVLTRWRPTS